MAMSYTAYTYTFSGLRIAIRIRLQMPGAGAPSPVSVPERITGVKLKESLRAIEELAWRHVESWMFIIFKLRFIHVYPYLDVLGYVLGLVFRASQQFYG